MVRKKRKQKKPKKGPNNSHKPNFSVLVQSGVLRAICSPWHTSRGTTHLVGMPAGPDGPTRCAGLMSL